MVADITTNLLAAFNSIISGIGAGVVALFEKLILVENIDAGVDTILGTADDVYTYGPGLSSFGLWIFALMGVALAIGVFTRLLNKVA